MLYAERFLLHVDVVLLLLDANDVPGAVCWAYQRHVFRLRKLSGILHVHLYKDAQFHQVLSQVHYLPKRDVSLLYQLVYVRGASTVL